ncbi:MAG TPA: rod shape-determining protein MreC [Candidatus Limnocylindrales bacterium]|nr:rod shape-determining protein MreC [Candidatus Limnocylindrales bacterium]
MTTGILTSRVARRRGVTYAVLVAIALLLLAASGTPPVVELQRGLAYAFQPIQRAVTSVADSAASVVTTLTEIDRLRGENQRLRDENAQLSTENERLQAAKVENDQLNALLQLREGLEFKTLAARVVGRDSSELRRVVTLDRGSVDGVAVGDSVVAAGGALAGRVVDVGASFAHVLLMNDTTSTVVGQLASSRATGDVVGQLGGILVMRNIDATEKVGRGDEVLTAGIELAGGIRSPFPKGLVIGQVVDVSRASNDVVQTAYLDPAADLDRLEYVLVITDYDGGLPPADQEPTPCGGGPDGTLPEGEAPCYTPGPSQAAPRGGAATPPASLKP